MKCVHNRRLTGSEFADCVASGGTKGDHRRKKTKQSLCYTIQKWTSLCLCVLMFTTSRISDHICFQLCDPLNRPSSCPYWHAPLSQLFSIFFAKRSEHVVFLYGVRLHCINGRWHWQEWGFMNKFLYYLVFNQSFVDGLFVYWLVVADSFRCYFCWLFGTIFTITAHSKVQIRMLSFNGQVFVRTAYEKWTVIWRANRNVFMKFIFFDLCCDLYCQRTSAEGVGEWAMPKITISLTFLCHDSLTVSTVSFR